MRISSKYTKMKRLNVSQRTTVTKVWKTAGALVRPKGMMAQGGVESCFPFVSFPDRNEVVGVAEVQFGENSGFEEKLKSGVNERVFVFNSNII